MPHAKLNGGSTDAELMMRVQADDPEAFELLFDRHWGRSFAVARIVCHDTGQAEEAVQDAFLSMWRSRATYRTEVGTFKAWSTWVVRNRAIDLLRRNHTRREDPGLGGRGEFPSDAAGPEAAAEARGVQTDLWASLKQLPAAQAEVIAMAFYGDLT